jgi:hypothetical protein
VFYDGTPARLFDQSLIGRKGNILHHGCSVHEIRVSVKLVQRPPFNLSSRQECLPAQLCPWPICAIISASDPTCLFEKVNAHLAQGFEISDNLLPFGLKLARDTGELISVSLLFVWGDNP